ncbi:MAG TPA: hypothetical protein DHW82_05900 [Spirochaetia bacterium]|nr:MAG: hypothetical protein A2Y41_02295 [Spirochaetes bacterium GWB1_36_13]HCL56526.1 hypothetical protein [Spirochaetia bacterium]
MKKFILLTFILLISCKKLLDIDEDHGKTPTPKVYSVRILATSNGNLIIENKLDDHATLEITGDLFESPRIRLYQINGDKINGCEHRDYSVTSKKITCSISLFSFYYPDKYDDSGTYWVRVQNLDDWSTEDVTITIY